MLDQRRRRWVDVVNMLYKCFVFAWNGLLLNIFLGLTGLWLITFFKAHWFVDYGVNGIAEVIF